MCYLKRFGVFCFLRRHRVLSVETWSVVCRDKEYCLLRHGVLCYLQKYEVLCCVRRHGVLFCLQRHGVLPTEIWVAACGDLGADCGDMGCWLQRHRVMAAETWEVCCLQRHEMLPAETWGAGCEDMGCCAASGNMG